MRVYTGSEVYNILPFLSEKMARYSLHCDYYQFIYYCMRNKYCVSLLRRFLLIGTAAIIMPYVAFAAANGDFVVTVKSELGYPVQGAGFSVWCASGNATTSVSGITDATGVATVASSTNLLATLATCRNGDAFRITATTTGYVSTTTYSGTYSTGAVNNVTATTSYTLKVTAMTREGDGASVVPALGQKPFASSTPDVGILTVASSTKSGSVWYLAATSSPTGGRLVATSTGYVNNYIDNVITSSSTQRTVHFDGVAATAGGNDFATSSFLFGLKVIVADQAGNAVVPPSATYGGSATTSSSGATLYWANTSNTAGVLSINVPGYLYATSTNTGFGMVTTASTSQVAITMGNNAAVATAITASTLAEGLQTALVVNAGKFLDEVGNSLAQVSSSPFSATGLTIFSQVNTNGVWYIAASSTDAGGGTLTAALDGYQSQSTTGVLTSTSTQYTVGFGTTGLTYNGSSLSHALKVTVQDSSGTNVPGATVYAGDTFGVLCPEYASSGVYYCAIPLAQTGTVVEVNKAGFVTTTGSYADRTSATDAQTTVTVTPAKSTSSSSGGSSVSFSSSGGWVPNPVAVAVRPNATVGTVPVAPATIAALGASRGVFTVRLSYGATSNEVTRLQTLLASDPTVYPEGLVTGYFGKLTRQAVQKFQEKYGVATAAAAGYGSVGPMTRAMLSKVFGLQQ